MDIFTAIASYFIIWWISLFLVMPIGAKSQLDAGEIVKGSAKSAPINPQIKKKLLWASIVAFVLWLILLLVVTFGLKQG